MSRRDIIIVAVLVNAGLLIVLFASALKSGPSENESVVTLPPVVQTVQEKVPDLVFQKEVRPVGDEVDLALTQFSQGAAPSVAPQTTPSSFADDLKSIATAETTVTPSLPQPLVQPLVTSTAEFTEVRVKKGDVLEKIARHHHSTVAEIMKANALVSTNLRIGQVLKIPNKSFKAPDVSVVAHPSSSSQFYTVKKGDSPWTIAVKNHLKVEDLLKLNNMTEEQARHLKIGDQIRIQ